MSLLKKLIHIACCCCLLQSTQVFSWNAQGHRLIALIAYDELTPQAKRTFNRYNRAMNKGYEPQNWVNAAVWLDIIRYQHNETLNAMHYINLYFSEDGTPLPRTSSVNAVLGIEQSIQTLKAPNAGDLKKGMALRVLLHVVGDIHQPMHATSRVSAAYPEGDRGGHFVTLSKNHVAKNLHAYWDNGGGFLINKPKKKRALSLKKRVAELEREYPCKTLSLTLNPSQWASESHELGVRAYQWLYLNRADHDYQAETVRVVKKRIILAGCRLGALLNSLA